MKIDRGVPDNKQEERLTSKINWTIPMFPTGIQRKPHQILAFNIELIDPDVIWSKIPIAYPNYVISLFLKPVLMALTICPCLPWAYFLQDRRVSWVSLGISNVRF